MWRWIVTDEMTKRRRHTRHHMTKEEASARYGTDAEKMPGTELVVDRPLDLRNWSPK